MAFSRSKLTNVVPLDVISDCKVIFAFRNHWVFKYGPLETVLRDNGNNFSAKFFQAVRRHLQVLKRSERLKIYNKWSIETFQHNLGHYVTSVRGRTSVRLGLIRDHA